MFIAIARKRTQERSLWIDGDDGGRDQSSFFFFFFLIVVFLGQLLWSTFEHLGKDDEHVRDNLGFENTHSWCPNVNLEQDLQTLGAFQTHFLADVSSISAGCFSSFVISGDLTLSPSASASKI